MTSNEENKKLRELFGVDIDDVDDETRQALLGMYDPSKSNLAARVCDYAGYFFLLTALIALVRAHWVVFTATFFIGLAFLIIGFFILRNTAQKQIRKYRKKQTHKLVASESLFIDDVWNLTLQQINEKRPLMAAVMEVGKIRPRKVVNDILVLSGEKSTYKLLRNRQGIDLIAQIIKDATGEEYRILYL